MASEINIKIFNVNENSRSSEYLEQVAPDYLGSLDNKPYVDAVLRQNVEGKGNTITLSPKYFSDMVQTNEENFTIATASLEGQQVVFLSCSTPEKSKKEHFEQIAAKVAEFTEARAIIVGTDLDFPHDEQSQPLAKVLTDAGFKDIDHTYDAPVPLGTQKRGSIFVKINEASPGYLQSLFTRATRFWVVFDTTFVNPTLLIDKLGRHVRRDEDGVCISISGPRFVKEAREAQLPSYIAMDYYKDRATPIYAMTAGTVMGTWNMLSGTYKFLAHRINRY